MPITPGDTPFSKISIDKIGPFPMSTKRNKYALVVVDTLTKYVVIKPIANGTGIETAKFLWDDIFINYGASTQIISDRGTEFVNSVVKELNLLLGTRHKTTTAYHPQADGQTERFMRTLSSLIIKFISNKDQSDWDLHLKQFQFAYNTSLHSTTGYSPFFALHGYEPKTPVDVQINNKDLIKTGLSALELNKVREFIKEKICQMQGAMKERYDQKRQIKEYFPLDRVLVYRPNIAGGNASKITPQNHKAVVLSQVNLNCYRVQFVETARIDVVNVEHMKPYICRSRVKFNMDKTFSENSLPSLANNFPLRSILKTHDVKPFNSKRAAKVVITFPQIRPVGKENLNWDFGSISNASGLDLSLGGQTPDNSSQDVQQVLSEPLPSTSRGPSLGTFPFTFPPSSPISPGNSQTSTSPVPSSNDSYATLSPSPRLSEAQKATSQPATTRNSAATAKRGLEFGEPIAKRLRSANLIQLVNEICPSAKIGIAMAYAWMFHRLVYEADNRKTWCLLLDQESPVLKVTEPRCSGDSEETVRPQVSSQVVSECVNEKQNNSLFGNLFSNGLKL
jgi:hypothetical protein